MDSWDGGSQHKEQAQVWSSDGTLDCQLQFTKELKLKFPLLPLPCGWDGASLPGDSRAAIQGFLRGHLLEQRISLLCKP